MIAINLLPKNLRRSGEPSGWKIAASVVPIVAVIGMAATQIVTQSQLAGVQRDIDSGNSELATRANDVREFDQLNAQRTQLQGIASVADALDASKTSWSADLARFVDRIPRSNESVVALDTLTMRDTAAGAAPAAQTGGAAPYDGKSVAKEFALTGRARSSAALVTFLNTFETGSDTGVQFQNATRDAQTGDYTFSATVGLVGQPKKASQTVPGAGAANTAIPTAPNTTPAGGQGAR